MEELQCLNQDAQTHYELGDLLRVRGRLREFRGQREITCYYHGTILIHLYISISVPKALNTRMYSPNFEDFDASDLILFYCLSAAKQTDPNEETRWMMELPQLYNGYYDRGFQLPNKVAKATGLDAEGQCSEEALQEVHCC